MQNASPKKKEEKESESILSVQEVPKVLPLPKEERNILTEFLMTSLIMQFHSKDSRHVKKLLKLSHFLASEENSFMTGAEIFVDGGQLLTTSFDNFPKQ